MLLKTLVYPRQFSEFLGLDLVYGGTSCYSLMTVKEICELLIRTLNLQYPIQSGNCHWRPRQSVGSTEAGLQRNALTQIRTALSLDPFSGTLEK